MSLLAKWAAGANMIGRGKPVIEKIQPKPLAGYTGSAPHTDGRPRPAADRANRSDAASAEVQLSEGAREIQRILQAAHDAPDVREDVVKEIRQQIDNGTYRIDVEALARRLSHFMK